VLWVFSQIFVEIERARLTRQLAKLKEEEGKIDEAAEILQEVAVVRTWLHTYLSCNACCSNWLRSSTTLSI
jgi:hypothetical protein